VFLGAPGTRRAVLFLSSLDILLGDGDSGRVLLRYQFSAKYRHECCGLFLAFSVIRVFGYDDVTSPFDYRVFSAVGSVVSRK